MSEKLRVPTTVNERPAADDEVGFVIGVVVDVDVAEPEPDVEPLPVPEPVPAPVPDAPLETVRLTADPIVTRLVAAGETIVPAGRVEATVVTVPVVRPRAVKSAVESARVLPKTAGTPSMTAVFGLILPAASTAATG